MQAYLVESVFFATSHILAIVINTGSSTPATNGSRIQELIIIDNHINEVLFFEARNLEEDDQLGSSKLCDEIYVVEEGETLQTISDKYDDILYLDNKVYYSPLMEVCRWFHGCSGSLELKNPRWSSKDEERGGHGQRWQRCSVGFSGVVNSLKKMDSEESSVMDFAEAPAAMRGDRRRRGEKRGKKEREMREKREEFEEKMIK
ncbi:hypothetical protein RND71_001996 [Anisodus tanguticus]|uniref:LysM domain-containing protein n=1 Tax=Anisodus tanguticus TaxID=243964 RepID=A0AAE1T203_9SOLA|nr:hypothetical protein RND71_001996 [Anisodus tanguticus]